MANIEIKDNIFYEIAAYCEANGLEVEPFINRVLVKGFSLEKYPKLGGKDKNEGSHPQENKMSNNDTDKIGKNIYDE